MPQIPDNIVSNGQLPKHGMWTLLLTLRLGFQKWFQVWLLSFHFLWILASQCSRQCFHLLALTPAGEHFRLRQSPSEPWSLLLHLKEQVFQESACRRTSRLNHSHLSSALVGVTISSQVSSLSWDSPIGKCILSLVVEFLLEFARWFKWHFQLERRKVMEWEAHS